MKKDDVDHFYLKNIIQIVGWETNESEFLKLAFEWIEQNDVFSQLYNSEITHRIIS